MYPNDVKVGDTVYVWGGDGFTKEVEVLRTEPGGAIDVYGSDIWLFQGEWFYAPVKFDVPKRPVKMVKKEMTVYLTNGVEKFISGDWLMTEITHKSEPGSSYPATLIVEVPEEE